MTSGRKRGVVSHQSDLSSGRLVIRMICQGGVTSGWFVRVVLHPGGLSGWSYIRVVCQGGLTSGWFVRVVLHPGDLSGWTYTRVVCQGGLISG